MRLFHRLFAKKDDNVSWIENVLNYRFKNRELIRTALTHRSVLKNPDSMSNERLEFLGDAVLDLIVSDFLYSQYKNYSEGVLTQMKATLVNETVLARAARFFNLGDHIFLSADEEKSGGREKSSINADSFEAVIGALYLDGGIKPAEKLIKKCILNDYLNFIFDKELHNFKGELLEYMQARSQGMPHYRVNEQSGPDHDKMFKVGVYSNSQLLGEGEGKSKKEAEQNAARVALEELYKHK